MVIDDGNRVQVVLGDLLGHLVPVVVGVDEDQVGLHQVADLPIRLAEGRDQLPGRDDASQVLVVIDDVDVVNRLQVLGFAAQLVDRLADGEVLRRSWRLRSSSSRRRVSSGYSRSRRISRRSSAGKQRQDFLDHLRPHVVQQIDAVVGRQVGEQLGDLGAVLRLDDLDLLLVREVAENLLAELQVGMPQHRPGVGGARAPP